MLEVSRFGRSRIHDAFLREAGIKRLELPEGAGLLREVTALSFQFPGEHCTECAAPDCHATCDLFERGSTGRCRRFADGIVVRRCRVGPVPYALEVLFRPWAHFLAVGNTFCVSPVSYRRLAPLIPLLGRGSYFLQSLFRPLPGRLQWRITDWIRGTGNYVPRLLNRLAQRPGARRPDILLCIVGNPQKEPVDLEISISGFGQSQGGRSFRHAVKVPHGWQAISIKVADIQRVINLGGLFRISVVPVIDRPVLLELLYVGFAMTRAAGSEPESARSTAAQQKIKAVVFDLDNTLWDGILIEAPHRELALLPGVRATLEELDRRGILLSIASKNYFEEARQKLEKLGVWDLFLHPQINWEPKSANVRRIAQALNIGLDTVAFVDDSPFELAEVRAALPQVRVYEAAQLADLPAREEFSVPVTEESRMRRQLYRAEGQRQAEFAQSALDYEAFLATCRIRLRLENLDASNTTRVHELVQRTNQLNFSGNRYTREDLTALLGAREAIPVVMRCEDRFGTYGIVGFSILRRLEETVELTDLMFSCRVQGKRIEHAFLTYLAARAQAAGLRQVVCRYRRTARNSAAAQVFVDLAFAKETDAERSSEETYSYTCGRQPLPQFPVEVEDGLGLAARLQRTEVS